MNDTVVNPTEADERAHLACVRDVIRHALDALGGSVGTQFTDVMEMKQYLQEGKADMDHAEKASLRQVIDQMTRIGDHSMDRARSLARLHQSPYFGRIDFKAVDAPAVKPVYIGIRSFRDEAADVHFVYDWRAPIASMFYDYELGEAFFEAPAGRIEGTLVLKRQYRIRNGDMHFMLETSLNIHDEVLQQELSRASDDRMRNIVATIQRDQNAIIRNERTHALIIQGAAGSGKTSIALHRIAFLLYKFKDSISSDDILIISPSKVFAHYISQVLPELGESMIRETTMELLAAQLLEHKIKFETFSEQVARLLESGDPAYADRIRFKADPSFLDRLYAYAVHVRNTNVEPVALEGDGYFVPDGRIAGFFEQCGRMPYDQQVRFVTESAVTWIKIQYNLDITGGERARLRRNVRAMIKVADLKRLYKAFYTWLEQPGRFKPGKGTVYEYADVFPLIYLKLLLEGATPHEHVKHLVIDEMQDYTPVQYQVIGELFRCRKTILGDHHQAVNPFSASSADAIRGIFREAECMVMNRSYRSTLQITELAQRIIRNDSLIPVDRHGDRPEIMACTSGDEELRHIRSRLLDFLESGHHAMGIICKTQGEADALHARLQDLSRDGIHLLNAASTAFSGGVIVATAHVSKGLEFDQVIVPFCSAANYHSRMDRHMLYVACTRAMHKLTVTHTGPCTAFLS